MSSVESPTHAQSLVETLVAKLNNVLKNTADENNVVLPKDSVVKLHKFLASMGKLMNVSAALDKQVKSLHFCKETFHLIYRVAHCTRNQTGRISQLAF